MRFSVIYEKVSDENFPEGFYYAHVPVLGLTTHGDGIEGAEVAAKDLIKLWIEEKLDSGQQIKEESGTFYSTVEV